MLNKLKKRLILLIMTFVTCVLAAIFGTLCGSMYGAFRTQSETHLEFVAQNDGEMSRRSPFFLSRDTPPTSPPRDGGPQSPVTLSVKYGKTGEMTEILSIFGTESIAELEQSVIPELIAGSKTKGVVNINNVYYRYLKSEKSYGGILVMTDISESVSTLLRLILISGISFLGGTVLFFLLSVALASWAIKPISAAWEKQKRFVSDASHELKTPLSVISANLDVACSSPDDTIRDQSKWLTYAKDELKRMNKLVSDLLYLARSDDRESPEQAEFSLSDAVTRTALPFESIAYESKKTLEISVKEGILYTGDEAGLCQVTAILLDNAFKNTGENGTVRVSLQSKKTGILLECFNTGAVIAQDQTDKIFERFYRTDASRARDTGGCGLGLAIAKSIVGLHKGKIFARSDEKSGTVFTVIL